MANGATMVNTYRSMATSASMEQIALKLRIEKFQADKEFLEAQETYFDKLGTLYEEIEQLGFTPSVLD